MMIKKIIFGCISIVILTVIFTLLNLGGEVNQINQIFSPVVFAISGVGSVLIPTARRIFLIISLGLLSVMVFTYLLNMVDIANWMGSLGFGMLLVISCTYLPQFIKRGFIEKF